MVIEFSARLIQTVLKAFNVFFQGRCGHYITTTQLAEIRKTEQFRQPLFPSNAIISVFLKFIQPESRSDTEGRPVWRSEEIFFFENCQI